MSSSVDQAADAAKEAVEREVSPSTLSTIRVWGESPFPPTLLATLITAQHLRPRALLPLAFAPVFLGTTYMNLAGAKKEAAGTSAAWAALYMLLAGRRRPQAAGFLRGRFGARGAVRGATLLACAAQVVAGGWVYATGRSEETED